MCTREQRRRGECPSVPVDCGYKATVSNGSVTIYPTTNNAGNCNMKIGIGDAVFQLDPKNPPASIKRILTKDASGTYIPQLSYNKSRVTKSFTGITMTQESHTNENGEVVYFDVPVLDGYSEKSADGLYESFGYRHVRAGYTNSRLMW